MATALGRPLIAQKLVEIARIEQAGAVAHGGTADGNDRVRARRLRSRARSDAEGHRRRRASGACRGRS